MKIETFDRSLIRAYMQDSSVLEKGVRYCQLVDSKLTKEQAKEGAIRLAEDWCVNIWYTSGYIRSEYDVFREFERRVQKGLYFAGRRETEPTAEKRAQEAKRIRKIKPHDEAKTLDFDADDNRVLCAREAQEEKETLAGVIGCSIIALVAIGVLVALIMWIVSFVEPSVSACVYPAS